MTTVTRSNVATIRSDLDAALRQVAAKHGLDFSLGRITFTATSVRCKLEGISRVTGATANTVTAPVNANSADMNRLLQFISDRGLKVDLTKTFYFAGIGQAKVIGYIPRRPKYPFVVQTVAGKRYKTSKSSFANSVGVTI